MITLQSDKGTDNKAIWRVVTLGDIAEAKGGYAFPHRYQGSSSGRYPFYKVSDMNRLGNEVLMSESENWVSEEALAELRARPFPAGATVFPKIGAALRTNKKRILSRDALVDNNVMALVLKDDQHCHPRFLYYFFLTVDLADLSNPGTVPSLTSSSVKQLSIPLPPLDEQRKIAAILSLVQRAIEQQERLIALTTELQQSLMHKLFTEGLHEEPQKQTEIGPVPENWSVVTLSSIANFLSGGTPSKKRPEFWRGDIPWVAPKDMKKPRLEDVEDHISAAGLTAGSKLAPTESVLVVVRGMILARDVPICLIEQPMAFNQDVKAIIPGNKVVPSYLLYALRYFKPILAQKVGRSAHGTFTLMSQEIANMLVPLPSMNDQELIASSIQMLEQKAALHQARKTSLSDLFQTLLHHLMTAQIQVNDINSGSLIPE